MNSLFIKFFSFILIIFLFYTNSVNAAESNVLLKPFTLANVYKNPSLNSVSARVQSQLISAGFNIIGIYKPNLAVNIFIITNDNLLKVAAKSKFGGFGAALRVSVTQANKGIQVAHNNPTYIAIAYNMKITLNSTRQKLAQTLGYVKDFGGEGIPSNELGDYNYAFGLEGFNGFMDLAQHKSYKAALEFVEAGFRKNIKGIKKVYRIDIPGKKQSVFGISLIADQKDQKFLNDNYVMDIIDNHDLRRYAHLPYELMVTGNRVIIMHPHYRLAINFPDLNMLGKHSFGRLMELPYVYEEYFVQLAGGIWPIPEDDF